MCGIVVLGWRGGDFSYTGIFFDGDTEHTDMSLQETVDMLTKDFPAIREHMVRALLFAAYISSAKPDLQKNPEQKAIYRPTTDKLRYASLRKWDVGVRYAKEKKRSEQQNTSASAVTDTTSRRPVRPHIRKAHWHTYRVGRGRTERRVLWLSPIMVGLHEEESMNNVPVVVHELEDHE